MTVVELVMRNGHGLEIGRYPVVQDNLGVLMNATFENQDIRWAINDMQIGDTFTLEERETN